MKTLLPKFVLGTCGFLSACAAPPLDPEGGHGKDPIEVDDEGLEWHQANLTTFESYPTSQEECVEFNGCSYAGQFAALAGTKTEDWVMSNNIAAVHGEHYGAYKLKTLRLRGNGESMDVTVYDLCSDSDCDGCCTRNMSETGFLIDLERYTAERFGRSWGVVEWACLDC
jgi:hypothetical protein